MPIYTYRCQECQKKFEYLIRGKEEEVICPYCQSRNIKKIFSPFAISSTSSSGSSKCSGCKSSNCSTCV